MNPAFVDSILARVDVNAFADRGIALSSQTDGDPSRARMAELVHKINSRMQSILGYAEFLESDLPKESAAMRDVTEILENCDQVIALIGELQLLVTAPEGGKD